MNTQKQTNEVRFSKLDIIAGIERNYFDFQKKAKLSKHLLHFSLLSPIENK